MERGVYFDAWFPRQHCYHPSLPGRRLRMVEDLNEMRSTVLVWSALGGGSLSLPYLENEAYGVIDPRFRFYGFLNDSEFIRECQKTGIKVFGIVFEAQGWEFPAEVNEDETAVLSLNELRGVGKRVWMGLREFSQNRFPKLWPPVETYIPGGLVNSDGEQVTDLIEECCSRDIHGVACHARWVECPDREHQCYLMDRNNPVWREYLKAVMRIQIDAGVDGVQLDEAELPITSFQYGGCFCKECMRGFREYLGNFPVEELPQTLRGVDLSRFHYGEWLLGQGFDFKTNREESPLFWEYLRFQQGQITGFFAELADYARVYAASQGRSVLVSGNFFNLFDQYYPLEPKVDLIITEMRNTRYRQPAWYRYVAGFAGPKPVVVVENPYGGVIPELIEELKLGRGYDLFRMSLFEAAALGANMTVPYGSWMGSVIEDAFYAPQPLCVEIQTFLAEHEFLFSRTSAAETAVVYSVESNAQLVARRDLFADNRDNTSGSQAIPFWDICEQLSSQGQPYDVIFFPEGRLRPDSLKLEDLTRYRFLILPDCRYLTQAQAWLLVSYLDAGGRVILIGEVGLNLEPGLREKIVQHNGIQQVPGKSIILEAILPDPQVRWQTRTSDLAVNLQQVPDGVALHIVRYDYDPQSDQVPALDELDLTVRLPFPCDDMSVYSPGECPVGTMDTSNQEHRLVLKKVPLYTIVHLKTERKIN